MRTYRAWGKTSRQKRVNEPYAAPTSTTVQGENPIERICSSACGNELLVGTVGREPMRRTSRPAAWKSFRTVDLTSLLITTGLSRTIPPRLEHSDEPLLSPIPDHEAWELIHVRPGRDRFGIIRAGKGKSF